jgi:hypothetical protein
MKVIAACPKCILDQSKEGKEPRFNPVVGELDDNGNVHVTCEHKHYGIVIYNARRYDVLMRSAARAFLDGYTNEVVAVMSSALERAYELYIRVSCSAKGIKANKIEEAWKGVAAQSERQFGAFQFLYLIDHEQPFLLSTAVTEIRNKVIHRGKIVRESEALDFSEKVFEIIHNLENTLQSKFPSFFSEEADREVKMQEAKIPAGVEFLKLSMTTAKVDTTKNEVTGVATKFIEHVASIHHSRERGFPL